MIAENTAGKIGDPDEFVESAIKRVFEFFGKKVDERDLVIMSGGKAQPRAELHYDAKGNLRVNKRRKSGRRKD